MPVFDDPDIALDYKGKQERIGLKCQITVDVFGSYLVTCGFPPSPKAAPREAKPEIAAKPQVSRRLMEFTEEFNPEQSIVSTPERIEYGRPKRMNLPAMTGDYAYQQDAVNSALTHDDEVISLPTGRGKTNVGLGIVNELGLPTIIVVPTIALLGQWHRVIDEAGGKATMVGGGHDSWSAFTLITYQSAILHLDRLQEFRVFVFDEVHHAFSPEFRKILDTASQVSGQHMIGLTASLPTNMENLINEYFPYIFQKTLAEFQRSESHKISLKLQTIPVSLNDEETDIYNKWSDTVKYALKNYGNMSEWRYRMAGGGKEARMHIGAAFKAYSNRKKMLAEMPQKIDVAADIIATHPGNFVIFTDTIHMADVVYSRIESLGIPAVLIHSQRGLSLAARQRLLDSLRTGQARVLIGVSSIEEGIDVPDLDNAIFLSNSTSGERKYIQRAGRILRPKPGKQATIYLIYARNTIEQGNLDTVREILGVK